MSEPPSKIAYEPPDEERAASAAPTESLLEQELPGGHEAAGHDPYASLRFSDYRLFVIGFFVSVIGGQMEGVAARYEIFHKTDSAMSLGWVGLALAVPMLLLTLPAGQLADAMSRRRIIVVTQLFAAVCALGLAWLSYFHSEWRHSVAGMYLLLGLGAAGATLGRPARAALLPQLVPARHFPNAVTWNSTIFETASVLGPAVAGFVCARNIALAYLIAAVCLAACSVLVWLLPEQHRSAQLGARPSLSDVVAGLRFVWRTKLMLAVMTLDLFAVLLGGATFLLPVFAERILHVGATGFGWLSAAPSVGAISMAMIQAHRAPMRHAGRALLFAVAGFGAATIVFGLSGNFWLSFFMLVLTGAFDNISVVVRHTVIQMLTPDSMRGRVSAVNQIFIGSSNELGGLESGLTAAWFGTIWSVVGGGIGTLVVVGSVVLIWPQIARLGALRDIKPAEVSDEPRDQPVAGPL